LSKFFFAFPERSNTKSLISSLENRARQKTASKNLGRRPAAPLKRIAGFHIGIRLAVPA
jgi:hypothetical protein